MIWVVFLALCLHFAPTVTIIILGLITWLLCRSLYWTFEMRRA